MAAARSLRAWSWLHTWSSLVCTLFILLQCLTGLPLIFHDEIERLSGDAVAAPALRNGGAPMISGADATATADAVLRAARERHPELMLQHAAVDPRNAWLWQVTLAPTPAATDGARVVMVDGRTAHVLRDAASHPGWMGGLRRLHADLYADLPGQLFLALMGLLLVVAIISGVVLYAPFMRRLDFGTVRRGRSPRLQWLDLHNLLGIGTLVWALAVAATGVVNTGAGLLLSHWQRTEVAERLAAYRGQPPVPEDQRAPLQAVLAAAQAQAPGRRLAFAAFPGTAYSSPYHVTCYLNGDDPLASRLPRPVLVDARTAAVTASLELPWYLKVALLARPLHVAGDGALPLKLLWALLDMATIVVLGSGLYLWLGRRTGLPQEPAPRGRSG
ncbi:MAG: PepSY domain-containing protein [Proteobacteria bacterium]|nr:PepSY domain-containing protein [Pseudomonadota bacterium]